MSYSNGSGSTSRISTSSDVALNNPTTSNVLRYDQSTAKWSNAQLGPGELAAVAPTGAPVGAARTLVARLNDTVSLDDFYLSTDAGDWALTTARAITYAISQGVAVRLNRMYPFLTTLVPISGTQIIGNGHHTGFYNATSVPVKLIQNAQNNAVNDTVFDYFTLDGTVTYATNDNRRLFQLFDSARCTYTRMNVINGSDWHTAFVRCTDIHVTDYRMRWCDTAGNSGGGMDGIHFLDSSNWSVDGADIISGDDCVAATVQSVGVRNGTIRNVIGASEIASIVTIGFEDGVSSSQFTDNIVISGIRQQGSSNTIIKVLSNNDLPITNIAISDVKGTSSGNAVWCSGSGTTQLTHLQLRDINVISSGHNGVCIQKTTQFSVDASGVSQTTNGVGIYLSGSGPGSLQPRSENSAYFGCQLVSCNNVAIVAPYLWNNGASTYTVPDGGGMRLMSACSGITVGPGQIGASLAATSYYGIYDDNPTQSTISPQLAMTNTFKDTAGGRRRGATVVTAIPVQGSFAVSAGTLTANTPNGCSVARASTGVYTLTLDTPLAGIATVHLTIGGGTPLIATYDQISAGDSSITIRSYSLSGAATDAPAVSFDIHDQP